MAHALYMYSGKTKTFKIDSNTDKVKMKGKKTFQSVGHKRL